MRIYRISVINADTGKITDLKAAMRLTNEAYAWSPARPGLLAFAEGGSRYLHDPSQLALLDTTTGKLNYRTGLDMSVSEPAWSAVRQADSLCRRPRLA